MNPKFTYLVILTASLFLSGCSAALKIIKYQVPNIEDVHRFPTETIMKPDEAFVFEKTENQTLPPPFLWTIGKNPGENTSLEDFLTATSTTSFLVVKDDIIIYENYFNGYTRDDLSQVFSVSKSVISILTGIAVSEGLIQDIHQPVSDYLPEFKRRGREHITVNHLLQMTSGLAFSDYKTLGKLMNLYYTNDQDKLMGKVKQKHEPGTKFAYSSMSTQILGRCLEKATGKKVHEYLQEKIWEPLGMEYDAKIIMDKDKGMAKMYGGMSISAVDLAKLGRLYLNNGNWNGKQIVPEAWVLESREAKCVQGSSEKYSFCWWLDTYPREIGYSDNDFFAGGFRGQVVYVNPNDNTIIIRQGKKESGIEWPQSLSKLALIREHQPNPNFDYSNVVVEGKYKSKTGRTYSLKWLDDMLLMEDDEDHQTMELERDSGQRFTNKNKDLRITINYKNEEVKGFFLEGREKTVFFEKI